MSILCLGTAPALDLTFEFAEVRMGHTNRTRNVVHRAGGKSLNVARALRSLNVEAVAVAPLGGEIGSYIERLAREEGISIVPLDAAGVSRVCVSVVDDLGGGVTDLNEPAAPWAENSWRAWEQTVHSLTPTWIVVSGSIAAGDAPRLAATLTEARSRGVRVAVDTHGDALSTLLAAVRVDVVKVNEEEASAICGPQDLTDLAAGLRERGAGVAVVTAGPRGSVAADEAHLIRVTRNPTGGKYTNGCGDSAMAGIVRAISRGENLSVALASGTAAAVANTHQPGAAVFSRSDYASALAEVEIA